MTKDGFEHVLDECCVLLTDEARTNGFESSPQFESRVREVLDELTKNSKSFIMNFNPHPQAFPDIAMGAFGVEVKFTMNDTWRSVANSVLETQRIDSVKYIYIVFGKMGGIPEVRWGGYAQSVIHVRTSHVPRFEVEYWGESVVPNKRIARWLEKADVCAKNWKPSESLFLD